MTLPQSGVITQPEPSFVVAIEGFTGPLDLLLHLVREEQLDLADIPVARIADQFRKAIELLGLDQAADYLEMAGRLVRLKIQLLLPRHGEGEDWDDPRTELVRRLLEYQQIKEIARELGGLVERRADRFGRGMIPPTAPEPAPLPLTLDLMDLLVAVDRVISNIPIPSLHQVSARPLDVEGATRRLETLLALHDSFDWRDALPPGAGIVEIVSLFLAILELARHGVCSVRQDHNFAPLVVTRESVDLAVPIT